jgi:hypothetical protein
MQAMKSLSVLSSYGQCPRVQQRGTIFLLLPQKQETGAEEFERVTLSITGATLVTIGCQLVVCRHGCGGAPSARARGSAPVRIPNWRLSLPPSSRGGHSEKWGGHMSNLAMSS